MATVPRKTTRIPPTTRPTSPTTPPTPTPPTPTPPTPTPWYKSPWVGNIGLMIALGCIVGIILMMPDLREGDEDVRMRAALLSVAAIIGFSVKVAGSLKGILYATVVFAIAMVILLFIGKSPSQVWSQLEALATEQTLPRTTEEKVVTFLPDQASRSGLEVKVGDDIHYINPTAPFRMAGSNGYNTITKTVVYEAKANGEIVIHGYKKGGTVLVRVVPR